MVYQHTLSSLLDMHISDVSKNKLNVSNATMIQIKSLDYHTLLALINQFSPNICCLSIRDVKYITLSSETNIDSSYNYKNYPICIKKDIHSTQITAIEPVLLFDNLVCLDNKQIVFVPIIGEYITCDRKLHQMTLIFDLDKHVVFLHDPNSKSLFNDSTTITLLQEYIHTFNTILQDYAMPSYRFYQYDFDNMNVNINFVFADSIKGNCVIASMVFMILYQDIRDASYIEMLLQHTTKDEYKKIYLGMYNKLQEYIKLIE